MSAEGLFLSELRFRDTSGLSQAVDRGFTILGGQGRSDGMGDHGIGGDAVSEHEILTRHGHCYVCVPSQGRIQPCQQTSRDTPLASRKPLGNVQTGDEIASWL